MGAVGKLGLWILLSAVGCLCSEVLRLSNETFHTHIEANPLALVAFCVPWYEPCQSLYPELDAAAEVLKPKAITVVSINCTAEVKLCSSYKVTSYPTLRVFRGLNNVTRFREKRKAKTIISYMLRQILPLVSTVTSDNLEELRLIDLPLVTAFVHDDDQISRELLTSIAEEHRDQFLFGISSDRSLAGFKSESLKPPYIILRSVSDHIDRVFSEPFEADKIEKFLRGVSTPLFGKFSMETYYAYTQSELPLLHIFAKTEQERQSLAENLRDIAEKYRGKMNFATIDTTAYGFFAEALGLLPDRFPALVIEDVLSGDTVPFNQNEEITADAVGKFVETYFSERKTVKEQDDHDEL